MNFRRQSTTTHPLPIYMKDSSGNPVAGQTVTVQLSKDGGVSFGGASGAVTEAANGLYWLAGNSTDRDTLGECVVKATCSGAVPTVFDVLIVPFDVFSVGAFGLWFMDGSGVRNADNVNTITGNMNGNLGGSVLGNVNGHVGSVSGNVGGNVLGFVASGVEGDILGNVTGSVNSVTNPATIVSGVWNALLTALTTAGSIGQKLANAVFVGGFTGPSSVTLTFHDSLGAAVPNVEFTIVGQGSGRADSNGQASFGMNDGTYTVVSNVTNGRIFPNTTLTVSGTTTLTITGSSVSIPPAPSPSQATVYAYVHAGSGTLTAGKVFYLRMTKANTGSDIWIKDAYKSNPSDSSGLATATAEIGATYQVSPNGSKWSDEFIVSSDPYHLAELVGNGWT